MRPPVQQAVPARATPTKYIPVWLDSRKEEVTWLSRVWGKRKGGWQTRTTPIRRSVPAKHLRLFSSSPRMAVERRMVITGQAKMIQRASGTGMKLTLARLVMKDMAPTKPAMV